MNCSWPPLRAQLRQRRPTAALAVALTLGGAGLWLGLWCTPSVEATPAEGLSAQQAGFEAALSEQKLEHFHKASAAYFDLIRGGLPRQDAVVVRTRLAECLKAIANVGLPISAAQMYHEALRLSSGLEGYDGLLKAWAELSLSMKGQPLYAMEAVSTLPDVQDPLDLIPMRYLRGLVAFESGDDGRAIVAFEDIPEGSEMHHRARFLLGVIYARQGVDELAGAEFLRVIQDLTGRKGLSDSLEGLLAAAHMNLARLAYARGDLAKARASYNAAASHKEHTLEARRELAWALLRADRPDDAWSLATQLVDAPTWPADARLLLSMAYNRTGDPARSDALLDLYREEVRAAQSQVDAWLAAYPRRDAERLARELLQIVQVGAPEAAAMPPLPEGLRRRLLNDWRISAAREQYQAAADEAKLIASQQGWWQQRAVGDGLPQAIEEVTHQTLRKAGLLVLDTLEAEAQTLDRLMVDAVLLKKTRGKDLGPLQPWAGAPLPPWPPAGSSPTSEPGP